MSDPIFDQLLVPVMVRFFLVFGLIGFAVGVGLIVSHARMFQLFGVMNRWVSVRRSTRWLSIPRDSAPVVRRFRHLIGAAFVLVAAFSIYVLLTQIETDKVVDALHLAIPFAVAVWIVDSLRWFLIAGSAVAIAVGVMLMFFPSALSAIETHANHWYSTRTHNRGGDTMHMVFDEWIQRHPRTLGSIIAAASLIVVVDFALLIFTRNY